MKKENTTIKNIVADQKEIYTTDSSVTITSDLTTKSAISASSYCINEINNALLKNKKEHREIKRSLWKNRKFHATKRKFY